MYRLTHDASIIRLSDGATIPLDERNRDYGVYLDWLEKGNIPEPAEPMRAAPPARDIAAEFDALRAELEQNNIIARRQAGESAPRR